MCPVICRSSSVHITIYLVSSILWAAHANERFSSSATSRSSYTAMVACTVSVNILVTVLISGRLLHMRRQQAKLLQSVDSKIYIGIVAILVESAAPLSVFGVLNVVTTYKKVDRYDVVPQLFNWLWSTSMVRRSFLSANLAADQ